MVFELGVPSNETIVHVLAYDILSEKYTINRTK